MAKIQNKPERALGPAAVARRAGTTIKALRYYEKRGLLNPKRTEKGWRVYEAEELDRLERIHAFKAMGFSVAQIAGLLDATPDVLAAAFAGQELKLERQIEELSEALEAVRNASGRSENEQHISSKMPGSKIFAMGDQPTGCPERRKKRSRTVCGTNGRLVRFRDAGSPRRYAPYFPPVRQACFSN